MTALCQEDQPRFKLLTKGKRSLTDVEIISNVLRTGISDYESLELARKITAQHKLKEISRLSVDQLTQIEGITRAKAITLLSAFELGYRGMMADHEHQNQIHTSRDIYELLKPVYYELDHEQFWVIYLNRTNRVICKEQISMGGITCTVADQRIIFRKGLECKATQLVLSHNHPSDNVKPSQTDIDLTRKMKQAGTFMDITLLDHVIVCNTSYYSFADEGML